jgi:hypothetical protein
MPVIEKSEKMVEVTVAPRRSIQTTGIDGRAKLNGPGSKVMVLEWDVERLAKQGFIIDPHAKGRQFTADEIAAADVSAYLPKDGGVKIEEDTDQKIIKPMQGKASR